MLLISRNSEHLQVWPNHIAEQANVTSFWSEADIHNACLMTFKARGRELASLRALH
jgi:hypothetical protein